MEKSLKKKSLQKTKEKEEDIPAIPEGSVEYAEKSPPADEIEVIMQRISEVESSLLYVLKKNHVSPLFQSGLTVHGCSLNHRMSVFFSLGGRIGLNTPSNGRRLW